MNQATQLSIPADPLLAEHLGATVVKLASETDLPILLRGEIGTGKRDLAEAIHAASSRSQRPFVALDCSTVPSALLDAELFGFEAGAFPGATAPHQGVFEQADGGTLFLDEAGQLTVDQQAQLLRVLQKHGVQRLAATEPRAVDVRVIVGAPGPLEGQVQVGTFRRDLFDALAVCPMQLPALRERGDDVVLLGQQFLEEHAAKVGSTVTRIGTTARRALLLYPWPGNVRELESVIQRAVLLEQTDELTLTSLPAGMQPESRGVSIWGRAESASAPQTPATVDALLESQAPIRPMVEHEKRILQHALEATGYNVAKAAKHLQIGRATLYRKIQKYGFEQ